MANSLSGFKAEVWSDAIVANIVPQTVGLNFVNSIYDGRVEKLGGVVYVHTFGSVTIRDYTPGTDLVLDTLSGTKEALNIDKAKYFNFAIDDVEEAQSNIDLLNGFAKRAADALSQPVDQYILNVTPASGNVITGTSNAPIDITSSNVDTQMLEASKRLDNQGVPRNNRWMVVTPKVANAMAAASLYVQGSTLGDHIVTTASFMGGPVTAADAPGYLGQVRGFDVYMSLNLPDVSGDKKLVFGQGQPIYYAGAIPPAEIEVLRSEHQFATICRGLLLFGKLVPAESAKFLGTILSDETA